MLDKVHEHIVGDLQQGARTDTIFVVTAIVFNLVVLGINSAVAAGATESDNISAATEITLAIFIVMAILVNVIAISALNVGKQTRGKLLSGLLSMYRDKEVAQYYDDTLLTNYNRRYGLFTGVILCLALTAVLVPLVIRFL